MVQTCLFKRATVQLIHFELRTFFRIIMLIKKFNSFFCSEGIIENKAPKTKFIDRISLLKKSNFFDY